MNLLHLVRPIVPDRQGADAVVVVIIQLATDEFDLVCRLGVSGGVVKSVGMESL